MGVRTVRSRVRHVCAGAGAAVASIALLATASPDAHAGTPGDWTPLSQFPSDSAYPAARNIDEPTIGRSGDALQVIWPSQLDANRMAYVTAVVGRDGGITVPARPIIADWAALIHDPRLITVGGQQFLAFSGLQSTTTGAPYTSGAEYSAASGDGLQWSINPGAMSSSTSAYADYGNDAVDNAGTPVWVGVPGTSSGITWRSGLAGSDPAAPGSDTSFRLTGCCAYASATARDAATGAVFASFFSNSDIPGESGIWAGRILPDQSAFARMPGSATPRGAAEDAIDPGQRVAMVARRGGGVYVAYKRGYPSVAGIRIVDVRSGATLDVPASAGASRITLAAGAGGRLWVAWTAGAQVKVAHSNAAVTRVGAVGRIRPPAGSSDLWKLAAEALDRTDERVDLVLSAGSQAGRINVWHTQALRTLTVQAASRAGRGAMVTLTVADAGDPVPGADVRWGDRAAVSDAEGRVRMRAPDGAGSARVTATKSGYAEGSASVRIS